jgi:hypothetical protein
MNKIAIDDSHNEISMGRNLLDILGGMLQGDQKSDGEAVLCEALDAVLDKALFWIDTGLTDLQRGLSSDKDGGEVSAHEEESRSLIDKAKEAGLLPELEEATSKLRTISESYGATVNMIEARLAGEGDKRKGASANGNP